MLAVPGSDSSDPSQSRKPSRWLRKTKLCNYHIQNQCTFGDNCLFAHSASELQHIPDLFKTQLCPDFAQGVCENANCNFAHGEEELKPFPTLKQKLCKWYKKGKCNNGDACAFAHGKQDLRSCGTMSKDLRINLARVAATSPVAATTNANSSQKEPPAWQPEAVSQFASQPGAYTGVPMLYMGSPHQTPLQEVTTQMQIQMLARPPGELLTQFVGQRSPPNNNKLTFEYKAGQILAPESNQAQTRSDTSETVFSWRRATPLSSKGLQLVPSGQSQYPADSYGDDMSMCAETVGYLSD